MMDADDLVLDKPTTPPLVANDIPDNGHPEALRQSRSLDSMRVKLWREANRERYNARERERMRKKRAARKAA